MGMEMKVKDLEGITELWATVKSPVGHHNGDSFTELTPRVTFKGYRVLAVVIDGEVNHFVVLEDLDRPGVVSDLGSVAAASIFVDFFPTLQDAQRHHMQDVIDTKLVLLDASFKLVLSELRVELAGIMEGALNGTEKD